MATLAAGRTADFVSDTTSATRTPTTIGNPLTRLRERAGIGDGGRLRRRARAEHDAAGRRPDECLDRVVDAVQRRNIVGDDLDEYQHRDDRHHPTVLQPCPAVRQRDQVGERDSSPSVSNGM